MKTKIALPLALLLVQAVAFAQQKHDLTFRLKVGDSIKHKVTLKMSFEGEPFETTMRQTMKATKVAEDGAMDVETVTEYLQVVAGGETVDLTTEEDIKPDESKSTYAKNGKFLKEEEMDDSDETTFRMHHLTDFISPDKPVGVGDTWKHEFDTKDRKGAVAGSATFKFEAIEKVGAFECAKVTIVAAESEGDKPASTEGTFWVRLSDGVIVKTALKAKNFPDEEAPMDAEILGELIP